jgi:hypothetical protein
MSLMQIAPPPQSPGVSTADHDGLHRLHFRLWQIMVTVLTVLATGWFCTLGPLPAIIALMVAKHVLVAVLVVGMDYQALHQARGRP